MDDARAPLLPAAHAPPKAWYLDMEVTKKGRWLGGANAEGLAQEEGVARSRDGRTRRPA